MNRAAELTVTSAGVAARCRATLAYGARLAGGVLALTALLAVAVAAIDAAGARRRLGFAFPGVPTSGGEAASIFAHNLRMLAGPIGLLIIAQAPLYAGVPAGRLLRLLRRAGEYLIAGIAAANAVIVGAALGAYGPRMLRAVLPHGPVELAAYALALGLCAQGRRTRLSPLHALTILAASTGLLAAGAALEVFAAP